MTARRRRTGDYTAEEIHVLVTNFVKHHSILSSKLSNNVSNSRKKRLYEEILTQVNSVATEQRSLDSVKDKWQSIKRNVKSKMAKRLAKEKAYRGRTGGGPPPTKADVEDEQDEEWEKEVMSIITLEQIEGENPFSA